MLIGALVVFGAVSYLLTGVDLFPDVDFPVVTITTLLKGASPETMETKVTDIIEEAVNTINGIKVMRSESSEGVSQVFIEFELEKDIDVAAQDVRDKVSAIRGDLPDDIEPPIIEKLDLDAAPILALALSGNRPIREITDYADDVIKKRLERILGVGSIKIVGGREREVRIWLEAEKLEGYHLSVQDVITALKTENIEIPGGRIETRNKEYVVKTKGEVENVANFNNLIVAHRESSPIRIRDIGYAEDGLEDERTLSRLNGKRAVSLLIRRQSGTNVVQVARKVKSEVEKIKSALPKGFDMAIALDTSAYIVESIGEVRFHLIFGGLLAVFIIFVFLRNLRSTLISAVAIPSSVVATFTFIKAMGFTFNNLTMLALSISVGMLIDDAIVVLENIYRHMERGAKRIQAAGAATAEIGLAVMATTFSIVAVFVPVAFMKGMVGRFFYEFGLTVTFAVLVSLFISFSLTPMLCSKFLRVPAKHGFAFRLLEKLFSALDAEYRRLLGFSLRHRLLVILIGVFTFIGSLQMTRFLGKEFIPPEDQSEFNVKVETPTGSSMQYTDSVLKKIESSVQRLPGVKDIFTTIGGDQQEKVNKTTILVKMMSKSERNFSQQDLMAAARASLRRNFDANLKISIEDVPRISGGGFRAMPIQFNIRGPSLEKLNEYSQSIVEEMRKIPGIVDIDTTYDAGKPEVGVYIDRDKAADLGVSVTSISSTIGALIGGEVATQFTELGKRYDVRVRLLAADRDSPADIVRLMTRSHNGGLIDLSNIVKVEEGTGPVQVDRQNRQRQVTLLANLDKKPLGEAAGQIEQIAARRGISAEYTTDFTGFADIMRESFANILFALFLAVILIYMILAAQFESFVHPFTIMLSLPLSMVGAFGALWLAGMTLNIFSMIGIIMLMGLVTKNAILLVDYTNTLRRRDNFERNHAILTAGPIRLRPILMTTASIIFGMLPIAFGLGAGAESRAPMAVVVIGGLITSTLLTLIVVPVVYTLLDDLTQGRILNFLKTESAQG